MDAALVKEKARAHIEHHLRIATGGVGDSGSSGLWGPRAPVLSITQLEGEVYVDALTASCLEKELALLELQAEHLSEDIAKAEGDVTCGAVRLDRLTQLTRIWRQKHGESGTFMASLQRFAELHRQALVEERIIRDKRSHLASTSLVSVVDPVFSGAARASGTITDRILQDQILLVDAVAQLYDAGKSETFTDKIQALLQPAAASVTSSSGPEPAEGGALPTPPSWKTTLSPVAAAGERLALQKLLAESMNEHCITNNVVALTDAASEAALLRVQEQIEAKNTDDVVGELNRLNERRRRLDGDSHERQVLHAQAKEALEALQRDVFMRRKQFIVTHRRLLGQERLPSGEYLTPSAGREMFQRVRGELLAGRMDLLLALANSDGKELRHLAFASNTSGGVMR
jgi:hypothetical protein